MIFRKRSLTSLVALPLLLLLLANPAASPQDEPEKADQAKPIKDQHLCPKCKTTGRLPNEFHEEHQELEKGVLFCSWCIVTDKTAHGLPWFPCRRCRNKDLQAKAEAEFDKLVKVRLDWLKERRKVDEALGVKKPLLHMETKHFVWAWSIPRMKGPGNKLFKTHELLHLYAKRMEDFYEKFQKVYQVKDKDNVNNKHYIYSFESFRIARKASVLYAKLSAQNGRTTRQGDPSVFVTWWDKSLMPSDEDYHRSMIHNVNHLLTAVYKNHWWLHECGIAYEGGSHWWEIYYYGKATSRCFLEANSLSGWRSSKWQAIVKKAVLADKQPKLLDLLLKPGTSLDATEHVFAWSYMDYMMHMDARKTMLFFQTLTEKKPARDAFKRAFNTSIPRFEEEWKAFVIEKYSVQDEQPAIPKRLRFR